MPRKPPKTSGIGSIDAESRPRVGGGGQSHGVWPWPPRRYRKQRFFFASRARALITKKWPLRPFCSSLLLKYPPQHTVKDNKNTLPQPKLELWEVKGQSVGSGGKNGNLSKAKAAKQDEFYSQLSDIEAELRHYTKHFKGKTVYCNCDDPRN